MPLYKYSDLSQEKKDLLKKMYSDFSEETAEDYLYNFDGDKYTGRQSYIPPGKTKDGIPFGTIHAESVESSKPTVEYTEVDNIFDDVLNKKLDKEKPVKKVVRSKKK